MSNNYNPDLNNGNNQGPMLGNTPQNNFGTNNDTPLPPTNNYNPNMNPGPQIQNQIPNNNNNNPYPDMNNMMNNPNVENMMNNPNMQNMMNNPNMQNMMNNPNMQNPNMQNPNMQMGNQNTQNPNFNTNNMMNMNQQMMKNNYTNDKPNDTPLIDNDNLNEEFSFAKADVRMGFIRKVYIILSVQLIVTAAMSSVAVYSEATKQFLIDNVWLIIVSAVINIFCTYALYCYKSCARTVPRNFILLGLFTITQAIMLMYVTAFSNPTDVLIALILTAAIVVSLTIYAFKTKTDFTICGGMLFMLLMVLFVASIMAIFIQNKIFEIAVSSFSVILFGIYLIYDTQLVVGKHSNKLSVDDYIIGALSLYIDIIQIFLEILKILAAAQGN